MAAIWLLHLTICVQSKLKGSGDKFTEGILPSLVSIVRGNALLFLVFWLLFMSFIIPITFSLSLISERETWEGWGLYVDEYIENRLSMD